MPLHRETRILPYTAERMYGIVADISRYPEFLPWCERLEILKREKEGDIEYVTAEMAIGYRGLHQSYVSRVELDPVQLMIEARHVKGPFKRLDNRWRFVPLEKGSEIHFLIDFAFQNALLSAVSNVAFGYVASRMAESFIARAKALYGSDDLKQ
jgi:coenzyme Q-binding protein COQ10